MTSELIVAVIGGDVRQLAVAGSLVAAGLCVRAFGLPRERLPAGVVFSPTLREATEGARVLLLPLPASPDGAHISVPFSAEDDPPLLADLLAAASPRTLIAGGRFPPAVKAEAERTGKTLLDYYENEVLQQKNALPTAEGAVFILMRELPRVISGLPVAVTGYGRVARALVSLLTAMGANVTVAARKESDLAAAAALGARTVKITGEEAMLALCHGFAAVFNTVPYPLFTARVLAGFDRETLMIDLASAPGGVDSGAAAARGVKVIWALSLPGKYAPVTAGEIIAEAVLDRLSKEGMI